jgi:hypothetical protein
MPQYFFITRRAHVETDDPQGISLPNIGAALRHAEHIFEELRQAATFNDDLTIVVKNELRETVLNLPFRPAVA